MIPFVAAQSQAERVSVFNPSVQSDHPLTGYGSRTPPACT